MATQAYKYKVLNIQEHAPEPFFDDVVIGFSLPPDENGVGVDEVQAMEKSADKSREKERERHLYTYR